MAESKVTYNVVNHYGLVKHAGLSKADADAICKKTGFKVEKAGSKAEKKNEEE